MARKQYFHQNHDSISTAKANRREKDWKPVSREKPATHSKGKEPLSFGEFQHNRRKRKVRIAQLTVLGLCAAGFALSQSRFAQEHINNRNSEKLKTFQHEEQRQRQLNQFHNNKIQMTGQLSDTTITWDQAVKRYGYCKTTRAEYKAPTGNLSDRLRSLENSMK